MYKINADFFAFWMMVTAMSVSAQRDVTQWTLDKNRTVDAPITFNAGEHKDAPVYTVNTDTQESVKNRWPYPFNFRIPLHIGAGDFHRQYVAVEVDLDLSILKQQIAVDSIDLSSFKIVRVDSSGKVIDGDIPFQIDPLFALQNQSSAKCVLTLFLKDPLPEHHFFHFFIYLGSLDKNMPEFQSLVKIQEIPEHEGQESYKITTPHAVYYYHKKGAGFASLEDRDGNDWLSYNPGVGQESLSGSGGMYRGTPNSGYPEGYCHPGKTVSGSRILSAGPVKATIYSQSDDKKMACLWDIFPTCARMTFLEMRKPYWFLYEGTPGGALEEESDYIVRPMGSRIIKTTAAEKWEGDIVADGTAGEWIYFADGKTRHKIFFVHHDDDEAIDSYWPMNREMTVFGFGRNGLEKYMTKIPDSFTMGLCYKIEHEQTINEILSASQPLVIHLDPAERRKFKKGN
ncbi:hypothetical protein JW935_05870 [candidate division KSB1 bacterium]|nr:hypothetical protein [candidate division KSB1 bacterium]